METRDIRLFGTGVSFIVDHPTRVLGTKVPSSARTVRALLTAEESLQSPKQSSDIYLTTTFDISLVFLSFVQTVPRQALCKKAPKRGNKGSIIFIIYGNS